MDNRLQLDCVLKRRPANALRLGILAAGTVIFSLVATDSTSAAPVHGWLSWRGPEQTGVSREKSLPDQVSATDALWTARFPGPIRRGNRQRACLRHGLPWPRR